MFRSRPAVNTEQVDTQVPAPAESDSPGNQLIPISVLALDLADPPPEGWHLYLAGRCAVTLDDIGRPSIERGDARLLLTQQREAETRRAQLRAEQDRRAEQQDQLHRASLPTGIPAALVPDGLTPAQGMMLATESSEPKAKSVHEQLLERELGSGESMVFNSFGPADEQ